MRSEAVELSPRTRVDTILRTLWLDGSQVHHADKLLDQKPVCALEYLRTHHLRKTPHRSILLCPHVHSNHTLLVRFWQHRRKELNTLISDMQPNGRKSCLVDRHPM